MEKFNLREKVIDLEKAMLENKIQDANSQHSHVEEVQFREAKRYNSWFGMS